MSSSGRSLRVALAACAALAFAACKKSDPAADTAPPSHAGGEGATIGKGTELKGGPGAGAPVPVPEGAVADNDAADPSYQFMAQHPAPAKAGTEQVARFVIQPGTGYKMNKEYPTKVTLEPPAGVTVAKTELLPADAEAFTEKQLTFAVKLTPQQQGEFTIPATVRFAVCTDATCDPKKKKVALVLKAE